MAAIRETFEESGILLARTKDGRLLEVDEEERVKVRKLVHGDKIKFEDWLEEKSAKADLGMTSQLSACDIVTKLTSN
jgi:8-oxo-dGTP pyrophosphatase MutT (NUDIX family)